MPIVRDEELFDAGALLWFNSKKITEANFWTYGQYAYGVLLPELAQQVQQRPQWTLSDGDLLDGANLRRLPACRDEEMQFLREANRLRGSCYVIAIYGSNIYDELDKQLRAPTGPFNRVGPAIGYIGKTTCLDTSWKQFAELTRVMSLIPSLRIEGSKLKKLSFDYFDDDALNSLGFHVES